MSLIITPQVVSLAKSGSTPLSGAVTLSQGSNITLTQSGQDISIAASGAVATDTIWDAKGDLAVGTGADTASKLTVGANNTLLVADSAQATGAKWSATLTGLTLTSPIISSISNTGTVTLPTSTDTLVGKATTDTLTNKTLTNPVINYSATGIGTNVRARAYRGAAQTLNDVTDTRINLDTENYDPNSNFDSTTNYRYTAPVAGYYLVSTCINWNGSTSGYRYTTIRVNNAVVSYANGLSIEATIGTVTRQTDILYLAANDYVEMWAYQKSGGSLGVQAASSTTYMAVHLLSV